MIFLSTKQYTKRKINNKMTIYTNLKVFTNENPLLIVSFLRRHLLHHHNQLHLLLAQQLLLMDSAYT